MVYTRGKKVDFSLSYPIRLLIGGSTESGKTRFIQKLLKMNYADRIRNVFFFGTEKSPIYESSVGLPKHSEFPRDSCIIIDILYLDSISSDTVRNLYENSSKMNWSIILTSRDLSEDGRYAKYFMNNSNYIAVSSTTNRLFNRKLSIDLDRELPYKMAYQDLKYNSHAFILFNQSEIGNGFADVITYISDSKVISITSDGIKNILFTKKTIKRKFQIVEHGHTFYAIKNDSANGF